MEDVISNLGASEWLILLICCSVPILIGVVGLIVALIFGRKKG